MSNTNYFSVSELAALGNVSRQTILYYDKHNLLKPNFIDSNGTDTTTSKNILF